MTDILQKSETIWTIKPTDLKKKGKKRKQAYLVNFTFMLPCIVIDFNLNNQPDALIIHIYSAIKL